MQKLHGQVPVQRTFVVVLPHASAARCFVNSRCQIPIPMPIPSLRRPAAPLLNGRLFSSRSLSFSVVPAARWLHPPSPLSRRVRKYSWLPDPSSRTTRVKSRSALDSDAAGSSKNVPNSSDIPAFAPAEDITASGHPDGQLTPGQAAGTRAVSGAGQEDAAIAEGGVGNSEGGGRAHTSPMDGGEDLDALDGNQLHTALTVLGTEQRAIVPRHVKTWELLSRQRY